MSKFWMLRRNLWTYVFEFDDNMKLQKDFFLGDPEKVAALMAAVANQGKAK